MSNSTLAWHFVGTVLRDGRPIPPDGEWLHHDGDIEICASGLHASERLIDALNYAPGSTICRVAVDGVAERQDDKLVARSRAILWRVANADNLLRAFARKAALSVIHLWDAPEVVRRYLETGDESLMIATMSAASDATLDARGAAFDAACDASARRAAAWAAASAASAHARVEMDTAIAASGTSRGAALEAALDVAFDKFNTDIETMVREAAGNPDDAAFLAALKQERNR